MESAGSKVLLVLPMSGQGAAAAGLWQKCWGRLPRLLPECVSWLGPDRIQSQKWGGRWATWVIVSVGPGGRKHWRRGRGMLTADFVWWCGARKAHTDTIVMR